MITHLLAPLAASSVPLFLKCGLKTTALKEFLTPISENSS